MLAKPLFGAIADRYKLQKMLFLAFQIITALSFFVMQFIPEIHTESTSSAATLYCDDYTYFKMCSEDADRCAAERLMAETSSNSTALCEVCVPHTDVALCCSSQHNMLSGPIIGFLEI